MNKTLDAGIKIISGYALLIPVCVEEFSHIDIQGKMSFNVLQYEINGLGNLSAMTSGPAGMQMISLVITPFEKNMPLMSADFIIVGENIKAFVELYDLVPDRNTAEYTGVLDAARELERRYSGIEDITAERRWYSDLVSVGLYKTGKSGDERFDELFCDALRCYMEKAAELPVLNEEEKAKKLALTQEYTDRLISEGGASTDVFKMILGEEKTRQFFGKVFFGTERR